MIKDPKYIDKIECNFDKQPDFFDIDGADVIIFDAPIILDKYKLIAAIHWDMEYYTATVICADNDRSFYLGDLSWGGYLGEPYCTLRLYKKIDNVSKVLSALMTICELLESENG